MGARKKELVLYELRLIGNDRLAAAAQLLIRTFPFDLNRIGGLISWKADIILSLKSFSVWHSETFYAILIYVI